MRFLSMMILNSCSKAYISVVINLRENDLTDLLDKINIRNLVSIFRQIYSLLRSFLANMIYYKGRLEDSG